MQRQYTLQLGSDLVGATIAANTQIGGMQVDNPSGSWLHVEVVDQYVPPFTLGWQLILLPTQLAVTIRFTNSPSGTPSKLTGSPVVVTLSDMPLGQSQGFPSGAAQSESPIGAFLFSGSAVFTARETASAELPIVTPVPGNRIVPLRVMVRGYFDSVFPGKELRTPVYVSLSFSSLALPFMISPETPFVTMAMPQGFQMNVNDSVTCWAVTTPGGGDQDVEITVLYYEQVG